MTDIDQMTGRTDGKVCTKCKIWKPIGEFGKHKAGKLGRRTQCFVCTREASRRRRLANIEDHRRRDAEYRLANPEKVKANTQKWREENPQHLKLYRKKYREENHDAERARAKAWRVANPDKAKADKRRQTAKIRATPAGRLNYAISNGIRDKILKGSKANRRSFDLLGYTREELMSHLERQFQTGMTWENYGKGGWHVDHIIPKSAFNYETPDDLDFKRCWALSNLQPLWESDNISKSNKLSCPFQPSLAIAVPDNDNKQTDKKNVA